MGRSQHARRSAESDEDAVFANRGVSDTGPRAIAGRGAVGIERLDTGERCRPTAAGWALVT